MVMYFSLIDFCDDFLFHNWTVTPGKGEQHDDKKGGRNVTPGRNCKDTDADKAIESQSPGASQGCGKDEIFPFDVYQTGNITKNVIGEEGEEKHDE